MRLWHEQIVQKLPRQQLLEQHREIAVPRGNSWERKHQRSTVSSNISRTSLMIC